MAAGASASPGTPCQRPEVVLLLSGPQLWWAYLAVLSGGALHVPASCNRIVYIDSLERLTTSPYADAVGTQHVLLFWDGVPPCAELPQDIAALCKQLRVTALVVGTSQCNALQDVRPMFPEGELRFHPERVKLCRETARRVHRAKLRNLLVPLKNVLRPGGTRAEALQLLCGSRRVVFCGAFGLDRKVLGMLDNRYGGSPAAMRERSWVNQREFSSAEEYSAAFQQDLDWLLLQLRQAVISSLYFVAAVRLLDRDYLLHRLRRAQVPLFTNQFSRHFIDVYSTPFYRQHLFLDFGSTISTANYPRTADLAYYRKHVARVDLPADAATIAAGIADGSHLGALETAWLHLTDVVRRNRITGQE